MLQGWFHSRVLQPGQPGWRFTLTVVPEFRVYFSETSSFMKAGENVHPETFSEIWNQLSNNPAKWLPPHHVPNINKAQKLQNSGETPSALCSAPEWILDTKSRQGQMRHHLSSAGWHWKLRNESNQHDWLPRAHRNVLTSLCVILLPNSFHSGISEETEERINDIISCHLQSLLL